MTTVMIASMAASLLAGCRDGSSAATITVSIAASLSDVVTNLASRYEAAHGQKVQLNAAASSVLARQIRDGAPADLFISADENQMREVAYAIVPDTRVDLLTNRLALITSRNTPISDANLASGLAKIERLAIGEPNSVPAGVYARQWLEIRGVWATVQSRVVPLGSVRAVLAAVREGRADAGIVYVTDARTAPEVHVAFEVSGAHAPRIVYPAAVVKGKHEEAARRFLLYLRTEEARAVFQAAGFGIPD